MYTALGLVLITAFAALVIVSGAATHPCSLAGSPSCSGSVVLPTATPAVAKAR